LQGAHGVFLVTNFWAHGAVDEEAQGRAAIDAAKVAGIKHLVWSTLPNVESISGGRFDVRHFTDKARVNALVSAAGFEFHTFVEAPFYFQNLTGQMAPRATEAGTKVWALPMDPDRKAIHMGDIGELGSLVAAAFAHPSEVGHGQTLSLAGDLLSWNEIVATLREQGHDIAYQRVPKETFDQFFPGAAEIRQMMDYFEAHTYFGPDAEQKLALARSVLPQPPTRFRDWAKQHFPKS
jgi:uncharacterized protein YbjT (DUF2867 family)